MAFSLVVQIGLRHQSGLIAFFVLLPAVMAAAILFDRGSGLYAALLTTAILYVLLTPTGSLLLPSEFILPVILFMLVGIVLASVSEGLRTAWERAINAERAADLLLQESGHRVKNNLSMVISMLSMQARLKTSDEARVPLEKAVARIHAIVSAHEHFRPNRSGTVEMTSYLQQLCTHLGDVLRDIRPIAVRVDAAEIYLEASQAVAVGLIVNELVTNALKHAFPNERAGIVDVVLTDGDPLMLVVRDDGVGCAVDRRDGLGSRLTRLLAQQLDARITWEPGGPGCEVRVEFSAA